MPLIVKRQKLRSPSSSRPVCPRINSGSLKRVCLAGTSTWRPQVVKVGQNAPFFSKETLNSGKISPLIGEPATFFFQARI